MTFKAPKPADEQQNPYLPPGMLLSVMEKFDGLNTSALRPGVPDQQCYWIDGFIPLDERNLRTLYSNGTAIYTPAGATIVCFYFANLGAVPIAVVFLSTGAVVQINLNTNAATTILAAATILNPTILTVGVSQWGQQYVIIVADQPNGYWLWDGTLLFKAGTLSPVITLTAAGAAYQTVPSVVISGGTGSGATAAASIAGGAVVDVVVTNPGSGYSVGDILTVTFIGGTSVGSGASLTAVMSNLPGGSGASITLNFTAVGLQGFTVSSGNIVSGGAGYTTFTTVTVSGGTVVGGDNAVISLGRSGGIIVSVNVLHGGTYTGVSPAPTITITDPGVFSVTSVTVNAGGSGYSASTSLSVSGGSSPTTQATLRPVITAGVITSVVVLSGGVYGAASPVPSITVTDTAVVATATASLMPYGIQGTSVETYQQRVWVVKQNHLYFTGPGSFTDFSTSNGGGNQTSGDSFLRVGYTRLLNTNGFLWLIADSSVSYISGVQTSGIPPTTTFTYQNADPEVGSPYPCSVVPFGRQVMLANAVGLYAGNGGAFTKISDPLDGVWNSVATFGGLSLSSAKAIIFGRKIFMTLVRIVDPVSGSTVNKLMMWNGRRWFTSQQDITMTFINSNEINSVLTAYGTNGTSLYALFQTASATLQKTVQSKLWDSPGYLAVKATSRFWGMAQYYDVTSPNLVLSVDNESGQMATPYTITGPAGVGTFIVPPEAVGQQGVLTGMTIKTMCKDMALMSAAIGNGNVSYRG